MVSVRREGLCLLESLVVVLWSGAALGGEALPGTFLARAGSSARELRVKVTVPLPPAPHSAPTYTDMDKAGLGGSRLQHPTSASDSERAVGLAGAGGV